MANQRDPNIHPEGNLTFRCGDVGNGNCDWQVSGHSEEDMMPRIEKHAREQHNFLAFDDSTRNKIRSAIHESRAA